MRRFIAAAAAVAALGSAGTFLAWHASAVPGVPDEVVCDTATASASASVPSRTLGVDLAPVYTIPGASDSQTTTKQVCVTNSTVTVTTGASPPPVSPPPAPPPPAPPPPPIPPPPPPPPLGGLLPALLPESTGVQRFASPSGTGTACSLATPCALTTAISGATANARIEATAGTYNVNISWTQAGGTATAPITLESYGGTAVLHAAANTSEILRVGGGFKRIVGLKIEATPTLWVGTGKQPFYISGVAGAHDIDVIGNELAGFNAGTTTGHDITAFLVGPGTTKINVVGNKCHNWGNGTNQRQCLYWQGDSGMIANNVVYQDPNGFGIQVRGADGSSKVCNVIVTGNTVVDVPSASTAGGRGIYVENNCSGVRFRNNISAFSLNQQEEIYGLYAGPPPDPPLSSNRAFTNVAWDTTGAHCANASGHQILDFSDGNGVYTGCGQNLVSDPLFVDRAAANFELRSGSQAIGYADPNYTLPYDIEGNPRHAAPDAGAYEH